MSFILICSICIRLIALGVAIHTLVKLKDWRIVFLAVMFALMALRQILALISTRHSWVISYITELSELPGLAVSVMALLSIFFLKNLLGDNNRKIKKMEKLQTELRGIEQKYRAMFETSLVGMAMNKKDGRLAEVNQAYLDIIGYDRDEAEKLTYWDLTPKSYEQQEQAQIKSMEETGLYGPYEKEYIHKKGHRVPVLLNGVTVIDEDQNEYTWSCIHDLTEIKQAESALRISEERFSLAMRGANDGLWDRDLKTDNVYYSPRWKSMLGYSEVEVKPVLSEFWSLLHPDDSEKVNLEAEKYLSGNSGKFEIEFRMKHKEGHYVDILSRAFALKDGNGQLSRLVGTHVDITAQKQVQNELKEARDFLETAINQSPAGILIADAPDIKIKVANPAALMVRGLDEKSLTEIDVNQHVMKWQTFKLDGSQYEPTELPLSRAILKGEIVQAEELLIQHENNEFHTVSANAAPIRNKDGDITAGIVIFQDITEHKRVAQLLESSNENLKMALSSASMGTWEWDIPKDSIVWSPETLNIFGVKPEEFLGKYRSYLDIIAPEMRAETDEKIQFLLNHASALTEINYDHEIIRPHDGERAWVEVRGMLYIDEHGKPSHMTGICTDITHRKQAEKVIAESELRFRNIVEGSIQGIFVHQDFKPLFANKKCADIFGFDTPEDIMELDSLLAFWAQEDQQRIVDLKTRRLEGYDVPDHYECRGIRQDGSSFWFESYVTTINWQGQTAIQAAVIDITDRKLAAEKLTYSASHDALTGLFNRVKFEQRAEQLLSTVSQDLSEHALCYFDLDQFKVVNDTCGHAAGDELLRQLATVLTDTVRHHDTLARLGGDEFGVLMEHCSIDDAYRVATSLQKVIQEYQFAWEEHTFKVGVSIGLVAITETTLNLTELLKEADAACYMAKDLGRNRIHVYLNDDEDLEQRHGEMQWVSRINQALEDDRFCLYAQAIVPLDGRDDTHYELLVRMVDSDNNIIPPGMFLPASERYNLITKIDRWVVNKALALLAEDTMFCKQVNFCSINLSGQSITSPDILDFIIDRIEESGIEHSKICFEITETAVISNLNTAVAFIKTLTELGCRFALDDFGSGLSSFGYLKKLPVNYLKIDGMFVKDIVDDPIDYAMVKSINEIGQIMGMETIAEFVENDEIKAMLRETGVNYGQGYGIEKPRPLDELLFKK